MVLELIEVIDIFQLFLITLAKMDGQILQK